MRERPSEWIFETTVLSAFALVKRLDLLEDRYAGRAHWCLEVHHEVLAGISGRPRLGDVIGATWLGQPIQSFAVDRIERMRQRLGGGAADDRHRGEAASIVLAIDNDWIVATDDRDATRLARAEGLRTIGTPRILQACVRGGQLSAAEAVGLLGEMIDGHGRRLPRLTEEFFEDG
ncbi:MAG TPA: hypothetical protein VFA44_11325 [Gaiellaceae bacterium]|nr:hypothetical protein [Gaiellaceae bacterium]